MPDPHIPTLGSGGRADTEQYPTQYCKLTKHTKTTQLETGRTTSKESQSPTSLPQIQHTSTQDKGGTNLQLTKQETKGEGGAEPYPSQPGKLTSQTKNTQQGTERAATEAMHPSVSQTRTKRTRPQDKRRPNHPIKSIESSSTEGSNPKLAQQFHPTIHSKNIQQGSGHTPAITYTGTRERRARHKRCSSASPTPQHHTPTQATGGPIGQRTNTEMGPKTTGTMHDDTS